MKTSSLIAFLFLLSITVSTGLRLDLNRWSHTRKRGQYLIEIPCEGGSGDYDYDYVDLPRGWYFQRNVLHVAVNSIGRGPYFGCRLSIYDRIERRTLRVVLIFVVRDSVFYDLYDADYTFDYDSYDRIEEYISNYRRGSVIVKKEVVQRSYSYDLPSWTHIEELIKAGSVSEIRVIIKQVIGSSLACEVKSQFLSQMLTRIQSYIAIFRTETENFRQTIFILKEEIKQLHEELEYLESETVNVEHFRIQLEETQQRLIIVERQIEQGNNQVYSFTEEIEIIQKKIFHIKTVEVERIEIEIEYFDEEVENIDEEIERLRRDIQELERKKQRVVNRRSRLIEQLQAVRIRVQSLTVEITRIEKQIRVIFVEIEKSREVKESLEFKIHRLTIEIERGGNFENRQRIQQINQLIYEKEQEIVSISTTIERNQVIIEQFEGSVNEFTKIIDRHYYKCFNIVQNEDDFQDDGFLAVASSKAFLRYLEKTFGYQIESRVIRARFSGEIKVRRYNIFSPDWIQVYGLPYTAGYGNNFDYIENEFSCSVTQDLEDFSGVIETITQNVINVRIKNGDTYTVHLGGCTEIESAAESGLPSVGDKIYWKGIRYSEKKSAYSYRGYKVTCF